MSENTNSAMKVLNDASLLIDNLERDIKTFFQSAPHQRVIEHNAKTGADTHKIKLVREIPGQFRSTARHIASDIRSALDHVGYAAAIATGKSNPKKTYFPFAKAESEASNIRKRNCKDFPQEIFDVFWSFKPYSGGDDTLYALNEIANCNKHRSVVPVGHGMGGQQMMTNFSCDGFCHSMAFPPTWDTSKNEAILCVVDSNANTNYDIHLSFEICFGDIKALGGQSTLRVLRYLLDVTKAIILAADAEGVKMGLFH